jgi:hypothetical protein
MTITRAGERLSRNFFALRGMPPTSSARQNAHASHNVSVSAADAWARKVSTSSRASARMREM